jgi:hypothetical protein
MRTLPSFNSEALCVVRATTSEPPIVAPPCVSWAQIGMAAIYCGAVTIRGTASFSNRAPCLLRESDRGESILFLTHRLNNAASQILHLD